MPKPAALQAVLDLLPDEGEAFEAAAQDLWARALSAVLAVSYPAQQAPAAPQQSPTAPAVATTQTRTRGPNGSLPGGAKAHADGTVTCPQCNKRPASIDAYRQHWKRYHQDVRHVSGPPPAPAPVFTPAPAQPPAPDLVSPSCFDDRARERAAAAAFGGE